MIPVRPMTLAALALGLTLNPAAPTAGAGADEPAVTAIDLVLLPDATLTQKAVAANARLRAAAPGGFALDATHVPHVSVVQAFVRTADLERVYEAVGPVVARAQPGRWPLKAIRYDFYPWGASGLGGIVIERTDAMLAYQRELLDALAPFTAAPGTGTAAAFFTLPGEPAIDAPILDYVTRFATIAAGPQHYRPHVTVGSASEAFMNALIAEPFEPFTTAPTRAAIYQLGNFGAARKPLHAWDLGPAPPP